MTIKEASEQLDKLKEKWDRVGSRLVSAKGVTMSRAVTVLPVSVRHWARDASGRSKL